MTDHRTLSMQQATTGAVTGFLEDEGCECIQSIKLMCYLAGALHRYEEEGKVLDPRVVLCNSIEEFLARLPGSRSVIIGSGPYLAESGKQILKECATLAKSGWVIFVERDNSGSNVRYGVMSFLSTPTSVDLRDMVSLGRDTSLGQPSFAALIERIDPKTVMLTGARGNTLKIAFSTVRQIELDDQPLRHFAEACSVGFESDGFRQYLQSLMLRCLNDSHGTILVCQADGRITDTPGMSDAVILEPPLNLREVFETYKLTASAEAILDLQRSEALVAGMLESDGIVVFDEGGRVTAYRAFFQSATSATPKSRAKRAQPKSAPIGGARRRAFEGIKALIGGNLKCALFRSQDGFTEFVGAPNVK